MEEEILKIACERKDGYVTTWTEVMGEKSIGAIIQRVRYLKDWMGGKFIDIHTWRDGKKSVINVDAYNHLLIEKE